jgi:putative acetyltransferase
MIEYIHARSQDDFNTAAELFREYARDINIDLSFQNFEDEISGLSAMYAEPNGGIILCKQDVRYVGCIAIRRIDEEACELKRMYVRPSFRNKGVGKCLLEQALMLATKLKYKRVRLDTLNYMEPAIRLYEEFEFKRIQPYYFNPNGTAIFFEKMLA